MIERIAGMVAQVSAAIGADADRYAGAESWAVIALVFDIAVKGLLIVAAAGVAAYLLRGASSAVRHFVWTLAAAALVALPVFALAMPRWQVAVPGLRRAERPVAEAAAVAEATVHEIHVARSRRVIVVPGRQTGSTVIVGVPDVVVIERPHAPHAPHAPVPPAWPVPPSWVRVEPLRPTRAPRAWSSSDLARQVREEARRAAEAAREEARRAVEAAREEAKRATDMARAAAFEAALEAELEAREAARAALERELGARARLRLELEREDSAAALMIGAAAMPSAGGSFAASFPSPPRFPGGVSWTWLAIALWLGGVAVVMVRVAVGAARVRALGRRSWCIERGWPVPLLRRLCAELGIERQVKLLEGDAAAMPLTWGVLRPVVLLPASTAQWPAARLEAVLRHELAHVRRFDVLTQLVAEIACALHWFNPLVWLVAKRLRIEREMACDDDVIASGSPPADYAADLVELARSLRPAPATYAAIAMARPAHLKDRVHALLDDGRRRGGVRLAHAVAASGAALLIVAPLAAMAPVPGGGIDIVPRAVPELVLQRPAASSNGFKYATPDVVVSPTKPAITGVVVAPRVSAREPSIPMPRVRPPAKVDAPVISAFSIAVPRADARQETICWGRSGNTRRSSVNRDDDSYTLEWEADGCEVQVRIRGEVRFSADFSAVEWISPGGSMRLLEEAGSRERRLDIGTGAEGLEYTWRVDRREAPFDAAANDWLGEMLLQLFRSAGYAANERSLWFLREHGVPGLLAEIEHLRGDHTRGIYYQVALEQGGLDATAAAQLIQRAAGQIRSDHELSRLLLAAGGRFDFNDAMRDAFLAASRTLQSDHERRRVLASVLERGTLDALTAAAVLASVAELRSDHEKAQLLTTVGSQYMLEPGLRTDYLSAAGTIRSDHEKRRVLEALIAQGSLDSAALASFLDVASTIRSDHETSNLLVTLSAADLSDAALQTAYLRAASTIDSDHAHRRVLTSVLNAGRLAPDVVSMVLSSALEIQSDHETAELLLLVLKTQELDGERRAELLRVLETIDSAHDHGRVSSALLRNMATDR